jgi:hypothetical protein
MIILIIRVRTTNYVKQMLEYINFSHFVLLTHTVSVLNVFWQRMAKKKPFRSWSVFVLMFIQSTQVLLIFKSTEV